jgi:hypothetical protein
MNAALSLARRYGITVRFADLGDWGEHDLRSEYDATMPEIRLNLRWLNAMPYNDRARFVELAVGHELYHHREAIGEVARLQTCEARESAADTFAQALLGGGARACS